jgi:trans-2,3-dihydro-3-hydroxyanthranilate isomerase
MKRHIHMSTARTYNYLHLDVFTNRPLTGNQLAVFLAPNGLDAGTMQRIALEMAFSETTFVFPPEESGTDYRVRIFTPRAEIPMAGHPTIGTTFALAHADRISTAAASVILGLGIGPIRVQLEWQAAQLHFAWMTQPLPQFGPRLEDVSGFAAALGLREADIRDSQLPVEIVSSGIPFLYVPVASRAAVNAVELNRAGLLRVCRAAGLDEHAAFLFTLQRGEDDNATVFSRMFAPGFGVPEDPATGSASGPLGGYLVKHGAVPSKAATHIISKQGVKMGRPSEIHISIGTRDGEIADVRVGGQAVLIGEATIRI